MLTLYISLVFSVHSLSEVTQQLSLRLAECQPGPLEWEAAGAPSLNFPPPTLLRQDEGCCEILVKAGHLNRRDRLRVISQLPSKHMAWPLMVSAEEVVECGSLHDDSARTSSCLEPTAAVPWFSLLVLLLGSLELPQSLLLHALLRGGPLRRGLKELVKTTTKPFIAYMSSGASVLVMSHWISGPQTRTKRHWKGIVMSECVFPPPKLKRRIPNPQRWWY